MYELHKAWAIYAVKCVAIVGVVFLATGLMFFVGYGFVFSMDESDSEAMGPHIHAKCKGEARCMDRAWEEYEKLHAKENDPHR